MASTTWKPKAGGPKTVPELRVELEKLARKKAGKALIAEKFTKDHIFAGHTGSILDLAKKLAKLRSVSLSTLMVSSMDSFAQDEVINWIRNVSAEKLTYQDGTWTIATTGSAVKAAKFYKFATVDHAALKKMDSDDIVKKSRKWLTESLKQPEVACWFSDDGTPVIYHLNY